MKKTFKIECIHHKRGIANHREFLVQAKTPKGAEKELLRSNPGMNVSNLYVYEVGRNSGKK